ncbi:MAG TPA: hypothetical protein VNA19_02250 [Pyrinomonadaceae bacterium]|jgi:hypothetical protein|nr:hypothetical protein [Pyrinomonadaceae bacterium]
MSEMRGPDEPEGAAEQRSVGGAETVAEHVIARYVGDATHLFLSLLAVLILAAAAIAAYDTVVRDFPKLLAPSDEYKVLAEIISSILLIAIAAELSLLLLFHRTSSAVEVILFVIARKIVSPDISALDLLLSVAALSGLLVVRFYYLPGRPK